MDKVSNEELAQAFTAEEPVEAPDLNGPKKAAKLGGARKSPKLAIGLTVFVVGLIALAAGVVLLVLNLARGPVVSDGEYLMAAKEWTLADGTNCATAGSEVVSAGEEVAVDEANSESTGATNCMPSVIWKFTEVGKGTLTTNGHVNDYDFIWALEDGKLKIETKWLYELENEYDYELDRDKGLLVLKDGEKDVTFVGYFTEDE